MFNKQKNNETELGFGNKNYNQSVRFLNKDGSVNIKRNAGNFFNSFDGFHWLVNLKWFQLLILILSVYVIANTLFAVIYFFIGVTSFGGLSNQCSLDNFFNLFFFSAQTLTTVGYGHIYPVSSLASSVAAIESMVGLMGFALITGLLYGRFFRPNAHLQYSSNAVVAPYLNGKAFMFRVANKKQNELIEIEAQVTIAINNKETKRRDFHNLELERHKINFLPLSWTIVHAINLTSPLLNLTETDFIENDVEFIISIKATNETFYQMVYSRTSYKSNEIMWDSKFVPLTQTQHKNGSLGININDIHSTQKIL